jgi:hypothetical protein
MGSTSGARTTNRSSTPAPHLVTLRTTALTAARCHSSVIHLGDRGPRPVPHPVDDRTDHARFVLASGSPARGDRSRQPRACGIVARAANSATLDVARLPASQLPPRQTRAISRSS